MVNLQFFFNAQYNFRFSQLYTYAAVINVLSIAMIYFCLIFRQKDLA
jgi:hypothetical protein